MSPTLDKIRGITEYPMPKTIVHLRHFIGMVNFYRKNLKHAAEIQAPSQIFFTDSRKNVERQVLWSPKSKAAFDQIRNDLANAALLSRLALEAKIRLVTDASSFCIGASLEQWLDNSWKPLTFF